LSKDSPSTRWQDDFQQESAALTGLDLRILGVLLKISLLGAHPQSLRELVAQQGLVNCMFLVNLSILITLSFVLFMVKQPAAEEFESSPAVLQNSSEFVLSPRKKMADSTFASLDSKSKSPRGDPGFGNFIVTEELSVSLIS
jgi:hypothetical protein